MSISQYKAAIERIDPHAYIMVEIADSEEMPDLTAAQIRERSRQALVAFGDKVDLWEVGNELNGDWVGTSPDEINAKALAAYEEIRAGGGKTAVTLNYWSSSDCIAEPWESTLEYAATMPAEFRQVDYVFLSIYETACEPVQHPSAGQIGATLKSLSTIFPNARLGIGEVGAQTSLDGSSQPDMAEKTRVADYYYGLQGELSSIVGERYVGGYFWWYFRRDVLEASDRESLWPKLDSLTSDL
ncbi:MAG: Tat pathway signal sequence [Actinomycetaceae bacterium]|nr:Tat pathway signal sequence [Actinomycetaceae bacterium]